LSMIHVTNMFISFFVTVIVKNNLIEKFSHSCIGIMRSSINTNSRIDILASWKNHLFKRDSGFVFLAFEFIEQFWGNVFANERFGSSWPHWWSSELIWGFQVRSTLNRISSSSSCFWS
jgi:hypothetical protein